MKMFVLALVCASLSGCMVQDTAHSGVSDAVEHAERDRVNQCLDECSRHRDCFSANHGGDVMAMCCGRRARCVAACNNAPVPELECSH